jgi:hypothetical protein
MGIYDDAVIVKELPARLPKICLFQRWGESHLKPGDQIRLQITGTALASPVSVSCQPDPEHFNPKATKAQILLSLAPFDFARAGEIEFLTYLDDSEEPAHRYRLEIRADADLKV